MDFRYRLREIRDNHKRVLVIGLGISGIETAKFLARVGVEVVAVERESFESYSKKTKFKDVITQLQQLGVKTAFGVEGESVADYLELVELCVLSPGVSQESAIVGALRRRGVQTVGELELGVELKGLPFVAVTGSNGKSTTVSLIHDIFERDGFSSTLCGNVGTPVVSSLGADALDSAPGSVRALQVVEVSSYQLESCSVIRPKVACLLNLSDNHLERHGSLERYLLCKAKLFDNQDSTDFAILNLDDARVSALASKVAGSVFYVGRASPHSKGKSGAFFRYDPKAEIDVIEVRTPQYEGEIQIGQTRLHGLHNRYNICVSVLATLMMGASVEAIKGSIAAFAPLEHRQELLPNTQNFIVINDSKSTTVAASEAAITSMLDAYPNRSVMVMLGGLVKAGSWDPVLKLFVANKQRLRVVLFGRDRNILADHFDERGLKFEKFESMSAASKFALENLKSEDLLLFTPGAASFDEFKDFEERGAVFKKQVESFFREH